MRWHPDLERFVPDIDDPDMDEPKEIPEWIQDLDVVWTWILVVAALFLFPFLSLVVLRLLP